MPTLKEALDEVKKEYPGAVLQDLGGNALTIDSLEDSELDREAEVRGTDVYFAGASDPYYKVITGPEAKALQPGQSEEVSNLGNNTKGSRGGAPNSKTK